MPTQHASDAPWMLAAPSDGAWLWPAAAEGENCYVQFRHDFLLDDPQIAAEAVLDLAADTKFVAWINGALVGCAQFADYPQSRHFHRLAIGSLLRKGRNLLAVLVYHQGRSSSVYAPGEPGLLYRILISPRSLSPLLVSAAGVQWRLAPDYRSGAMPMISPQLTFSFEFDARGFDGWIAAENDPGEAWRTIGAAEARLPEGRRKLVPWPLARLQTQPALPGRLIASGTWWLAQEAAAWPPARRMQEAVLIPEGEEISEPVPDGALRGRYWRVDLGCEEVGLLDLEITAAAGTELAIGYGEHLSDGRVRTHIGNRHFASGYRCREGRQTFTHWMTRWAGRYLELHLSGVDQDVQLHHLSLRPQRYPVPEVGSFQSDDPLLNQIYDVSVRTLQLCMHEHYEDCPWREQALYANDMRNQAICGYTVFGNADFAAHSLGLLGAGLREHGYLNLTAPTEQVLVIPAFTMAWILAAADHYRYSGDRGAAEAYLAVIHRIWAILLPTLQHEQLPLLERPDHWHFYDWAGGLSGERSEPTPPGGAVLNLFFLLALKQAAWLAEELGDPATARAWSEQHARSLASVHATYWDAAESAYRLHPAGADHLPVFAELAQALALLAGLPDAGDAAGLRTRLAAGQPHWVPTTLSQAFYKFEALMMEEQLYGLRVLDLIRQDWGAMLEAGASSFWETIEGEAAFDGAGSLCHGWSAIPIYFLHRYALGARPTTPGCLRIEKPDPPLLSGVCGSVWSPGGMLSTSDA